jgi:glycerophosphoryl diester phosphodiesterase
VLLRLRELAPGARLGLLLSARSSARPLARARAVGAEAIHPWWGLATGELVAQAHGEGLAVYPYTVDEPDAMRRLLDLGVDGLFTNHPDRLRNLLGTPEGAGLPGEPAPAHAPAISEPKSV